MQQVKSEQDLNNGDLVRFRSQAGMHTGTADFDFGDERPGHVRVQEIQLETSDIGNTFYVPIENIINEY